MYLQFITNKGTTYRIAQVLSVTCATYTEKIRIGWSVISLNFCLWVELKARYFATSSGEKCGIQHLISQRAATQSNYENWPSTAGIAIIIKAYVG